MAQVKEAHKNDIGTKIVLEVHKQGSAWTAVASATTKQIKIKHKKTGATQTFSANFAQAPDGVGDGSDGKIEYITTSTSDLPEAGIYEVQGYLVIPSVFTGNTQKSTISVKDTI